MLDSVLFTIILFMSMVQPPPPGLPIDSGLVILFLIAIIFGAYKMLQINKQKD